MTQASVKTKKPVGVQSKKTPTPTVVTHEQISARAREIWMAKGRPSGNDEAIWLEAEAQLKKGS